MNIADTPTTLAFHRREHDEHRNAWYQMCLSLARQARGLPGVYVDAWTAWGEAAHKHPVTSQTVDWHQVPSGAPLFYRGGSHGHIATYVGFTKVGPLCWTNDAAGHGLVSMVHPLWFEPHWNHYLVGWTSDLEGFELPLHQPTTLVVSLSAVQAAAKADGRRAQGVGTPGARRSVFILERGLVQLGYVPAHLVDGAYGTSTASAYKRWQQALGFKGKDADGVPGQTSLQALGDRFGFRVVA